MLRAKVKMVQSPNARTQYITVPAAMVTDSQYPFKTGESVEIILNPSEKKLEIHSVKAKKLELVNPELVRP